MSLVEPIPDAAAAVATLGNERALVVADYHAGIEAALRYDGVELESRASERRERVLELIEQVGADRVVFLGDLAHWISKPAGAELDEITALLEAVTELVPAVLVKGNHDGLIEDTIEIDVTPSHGMIESGVGFLHGHSTPDATVLEADVVCLGHEHAMVRLEDAVGGRRIEKAWLRGELAPEAFDDEIPTAVEAEVVVFPAFNELVGGTWVNVEQQSFLSPMLPEGLRNGEVYLLDGTRLGRLAQL